VGDEIIAMTKRLFDILASALGLLLLSPFFGIIAWAIKRDSPGPVFYHSGRRVGQNGREFRILKFRSMYERSESYQGAKITAKDDQRITQVGKWLRAAKLNELPQLWNVLKGEMSLVGPRPEDPEIVTTWPEDTRNEILSVRPGITSPASVLYRDEETMLQGSNLMDTYLNGILPSKLRLDQLYVRNRSFWLDVDVLFWTSAVLMPKLRSHKPSEDVLLSGPLSRFSQRYLNWFILDALVAFIAIGLAGLYWRSFGPLDVGWYHSIVAALAFSMLFSLIGALFGIQRIDWSKAVATDAYDLVLPTALASGASYLANRFLDLFPNGLVFLASALAFVGFVLARYRIRLVTGLISRILRYRPGIRAARERVLIVGGGEAGQFAAWMIGNSKEGRVFHLVGFVDDDLYKQHVRIRGLDVLGKREEIPELVAKHDIGIIVFAIHNIPIAERKKLLKVCQQTSARIVMLPDFLGKMRVATALGDTERTSDKRRGFTQPEISTAQVDAWLQELESPARQGDTREVLKLIRSLRAMLQK